MIKDCPLNIECKLVEVIETGRNEIFIGDIVETYTEERFMTDGKLDLKKMKPFILSQPGAAYWSIGEPIAKAWNIGKGYKNKSK